MGRILRRLSVDWMNCSPGYMLTKLTKTILAHDAELKVSTRSSIKVV